jgi:hypothetical protein
MREIHGPFIIFKPINVGMITILQNVKKKISNSNVGILSMKLFILDNIEFILDGLNRYKIEIKSTTLGIAMSEINDLFIIFI